jgi:hypothetical protein
MALLHCRSRRGGIVNVRDTQAKRRGVVEGVKGNKSVLNCYRMQQPNSNKANTIMVAASSTQVDVRRNAGGTHAGRTPGIYTHGTLAVLAVSDTWYVLILKRL